MTQWLLALGATISDQQELLPEVMLMWTGSSESLSTLGP